MSANQWQLQWPYMQQGGPLPVVNDTTPDPLARLTALNGQRQAAAQDTGNTWDYQPGGQMSVDYASPGQTSGSAPAQGGGTFGYSYSSPGQGFNPWGMYDGRNGFDGSASDGVGLYQAAKDSKKGWGPNGQGETDRDRVWRMTLDDLKAKGIDPGSADPATLQSTFLNNIARLHRDYDNTPGLGAAAWANSAFAGYDKLAGGTGSQAGTTTQQGGTRGGDGQGNGQYIPGVSRPTDFDMFDQNGNVKAGWYVQPNNGQGAPGSGTNDGGAARAAAAAGFVPMTPAEIAAKQAEAARLAGAAQALGDATKTGGTSVNPNDPTQDPGQNSGGGTSTTTTTPGQFGGAGVINAADPQSVVRQYMQTHGMNPDSNGFLSGTIQKMMSALIPAIMKLTLGANGKPALDRLGNINGLLDPIFYGGGGTLGGNLQRFGNDVQGQLPKIDMAGMQSSDQADLLRNLLGLQNFGENHYVSSASNNRLDAAINSAADTQFNLEQQGKDPGNYNLWDYIQHHLPQGGNYVNPWR